MQKVTKYITLNDGNKIPSVGFGTWQTPDGDVAEESVLTALKAGYRHIDTAKIYGNEVSVGKALKKSGIPREEIFLTTKLWNTEHTYEKAKQSINDQLEKLGVDYFDLYLIHWPNPVDYRDDWAKSNADSWRAMEEAVAEGKIKSIGVSNFHPHHLDALLKTAKIKPAINQVYLNPSDQQPELVDYFRKHDIHLEAYSPLGTGKIFEIEELKELAAKYNKSVAQLAIRWSLQHGFIPLPKSVTPERIIANLDVYDFEITEADMAIIDAQKGKSGEARNPDEVQF